MIETPRPSISSLWQDLLTTLRESGEVSEDVLSRAAAIASSGAERLDRALMLCGADEWVVTRALASVLGCPVCDPVSDPPDHRAVSAVPRQLAVQMRVLPVRIEDGALVVAVADHSTLPRLHELSMATGMPVKPALTTEHLLTQAMQVAYPSEELAEILSSLGQVAPRPEQPAAPDDQDVAGAPVVRLVSTIIDRAVREHASDIHLQPRPGASRVRFRIDGVLHDIAILPPDVHTAAVARVKAISGMDVSERRAPQDGRIRSTVRATQVDVRVATLPTPFGEQVVMRLLQMPGQQVSLRRLGMTDAQVAVLHAAVERTAGGLILVCGPTGAGKTTTLYVLLQRCNSPDRAVATVEDPVEYEVPGVTQVAVNPKAGLGFPAALRGILRSDPDVIMVGEIRDPDTARLAIEAALTGHTVLSSLHTRTAPGAFDRLLQMGIEPYLIASSVSVVVAQRLVRTVCQSCASDAPLPVWASELLPLSAASGKYRRGTGCPSCRMTGYRGRTGVFEVLVATDSVREAVMSRQPEPSIAAIASVEGYEPMIRDADAKVASGITTPEEIVRAGIALVDEALVLQGVR